MPTPPDFSSGTALAAASLNKVGLWLTGEGTATAGGANITIANCFSADYGAYKVVASGIRCSTGTRFLNFQLRAGGTTSITSYYWTTVSAGGAWSFASGSSPDSVYRSSIVIDSTNYGGGTVEIQNPGTAVETSFQSSGTDSRTTGDWIRLGGGWHDVTTAYTDLVISVAADTWANGTIRVYGYRN